MRFYELPASPHSLLLCFISCEHLYGKRNEQGLLAIRYVGSKYAGFDPPPPTQHGYEVRLG